MFMYLYYEQYSIIEREAILNLVSWPKGRLRALSSNPAPAPYPSSSPSSSASQQGSLQDACEPSVPTLG